MGDSARFATPRATGRSKGRVSVVRGVGQVSVCSSGDSVILSEDGAAILLSEASDLGQLPISQGIVSLGQVVHGIVKPVFLVLGTGFQDPASQDVAE